MTTITIQLTRATAPAILGAGVAYGGTNVVVKDNSGATLPGKILGATETTAVFTGTPGPNEAQVTITDVDTKGIPIGAPLVVTETGTGGIPQTFLPVAGATITVV